MNTSERLVELYYRQKGYFTVSDIKVPGGNNRQFDILAVDYKNQKGYHIEVSFTHMEQWKSTLDDITDNIRYKFFGIPNNSRPDNPNTDYAKGKNYKKQIKNAYTKFGLEYNDVIRVWCTWCPPDGEILLEQWKQKLAEEFELKPENFELLLFRDTVLPKLLENIGTSNYDDELLRTLSLIKQYNSQLRLSQPLG